MMRGYGGFPFNQGFGMMGSFSWFGLFICLLAIVLVVLGIIFLLKLVLNKGTINRTVSNQSNIEILKVRLAKGEISKEEYDSIRKSL